MAASPRAVIEKQVRVVRRRMMLQSLAHFLLLSWAVALFASALWFIAQPLFFTGDLAWLRWIVPGALFGVGTLAALVLTGMSAPALVQAALVLDEKCALKERVTTYLMLPEPMLDSPAGHALVNDVQEQLAKLNTSGRFPVRINWQTGLLPVVACVLALAAAFFAPALSSVSLARNTRPKHDVDPKEIQQQLDNLRKVSFTPKDPELKSEEFKELEAAWEKLVNKPLDPNNEERIRERVTEMKALEDQFRKRAEDLKSQTSKTRDLLHMLEKLAMDGDKKFQPGPAKDLEDALSKGNLDKAREVLDKLAKDLKNDKLDPEKQKELAKQFDELQKKLERLLDRDDMKKELKKKLDNKEITKEQFDREMNNLKNLAQEMPELKDLADLLGQCKDCMNKGEGEKAGEKIAQALEKVKTIELTEEELREIEERLENLEDAENRILGQLQGNGMQGGGPPGGERPIDPDDPKSKIVQQRQKAHVDPKGQHQVTGFAKGGNFMKVPANDIGGAFRQAAQEAPEAIDRQRIPQDAADIARGYFNKLGGQKE